MWKILSSYNVNLGNVFDWNKFFISIIYHGYLVSITIALEFVSQHILQKSSRVECSGPCNANLAQIGRTTKYLNLGHNELPLRVESRNKTGIDEITSFFIICGLKLHSAVVIGKNIGKPEYLELWEVCVISIRAVH